jgi:hypothetical protein
MEKRSERKRKKKGPLMIYIYIYISTGWVNAPSIVIDAFPLAALLYNLASMNPDIKKQIKKVQP